ncbi:DUF4268 domain-containing protein [Ramlibacter montanisoli]|uniref:DUF4268 domain-containing protein n=1 Tax=Ramlibacter montanisoli TaxID=2732512 RepID=A0A849KDN3_9BURK|nr:DUF4268 domain-containing protein [Ramlibacter montanisoli]NNU43586.1 DUF4268 domain-containing protein [Ramlibacter montanisoli]
MNAFTSPILVRNGAANVLPRIPLTASHSAFSEKWLQQQLFEHPLALPLREIAPNVSEPVPVCMELNTVAGPADILYVTGTGQIILVETKLWRNPEARREVIAQILDYAKELTTWTYEDLAREVARATGRGPKYLLDVARGRYPDLDEARFVDGINHNLRTGDIVLLVVGDGIRTGAEALVAFLERYGSLRFTFGLIEVAAYDVGDGDVLLQPRVLAKTEVMRRVVVVPVDRAGGELAIDLAAGDLMAAAQTEGGLDQTQLTDYQRWLQSFWAEYMRRLKLDDTRQPIPKTVPRSTNAYFPMPPSGAESWISAYVARSSGVVGVYLTWASTYADAASAFEYLQGDKEAIEIAIEDSVAWSYNGKVYSVGVKAPLGEWSSEGERVRALDYLLTMTNRFVNVFRPRLEAFTRGRN